VRKRALEGEKGEGGGGIRDMASTGVETLQVAEQVGIAVAGFHPERNLHEARHLKRGCQTGAGELQVAALVQVVVPQGVPQLGDGLVAGVALDAKSPFGVEAMG